MNLRRNEIRTGEIANLHRFEGSIGRESILALFNVGSPESCDKRGIRRFLRRFLTDKYVIGLPAVFRHLLVRAIIIPLRWRRSLGNYRRIWTPEGPPLTAGMERLAARLREELSVPVIAVPRYGTIPLHKTLREIRKKNPQADRIVFLLLYPQYASSITATAIEYIHRQWKRSDCGLGLQLIAQYHDHPAYIGALAASIRPAMRNRAHLLFSYHSIPERQNDRSASIDPANDYRRQTVRTSELTAARLELEKNGYSTAYQSAMKGKWLSPSTKETLAALAGRGIRDIVAISPGFAVENLETLADLGQQASEAFLSAGGSSFTRVPCLDASDEAAVFIKTLLGR